SAPSTASTRVSALCTFTRTNVSTAVPASRYAPSRRSSTRTTRPTSGRTSTRRTWSSSRTSAPRAAPRSSVRSRRTTRSSPRCRRRARVTDRPGMDHRSRTLADRLPQFPWDRLAPYARKADAHPGGRVDLSVGTPVDPVPSVVREALIEAADWPGYPATRGTDALRAAALGWMRRELGVAGEPGVLPVIGSKELVANLPALLGLGAGDRVAYPVPAYPTYEIGALLAGAEPLPTPFGELPDAASGPAPRLVWLNSPANPHG